MDLLEIILQVIWILLEIFIDAGIGFGGDNKLSKREWSFILIVAVAIALGIGIGYISYEIYPNYLVTNKTLRVVNLIISPILAGIIGGYFAYKRAKDAKEDKAIRHFVVSGLLSSSILLTRSIMLAQIRT